MRPASSQALAWLWIQQRVEVDAPADPEGLRHQDLRRVFIPKRGTQSLNCWEAKVIRKAEDAAMPRSLLRRTSQLIPDGCTYQNREYNAPNHVPDAKSLLALHDFLLLYRTEMSVYCFSYLKYERSS